MLQPEPLAGPAGPRVVMEFQDAQQVGKGGLRPLILGGAVLAETIPTAAGFPVTAHLSLIAALLLLALSLSPFATAAALRVSLS